MNLPWLAPLQEEFLARRAAGRLAHALLISGPSGCGKRQFAGGIMASLLCLEQDYPACGRCRSCELLAGGAHPDGFTMTFEEHPKTHKLRTELVVEQVRRLIDSFQLTRTISPYKAVLIHPAEALNISAANALLKTLEEPTGDATLILVSDNPTRLPATVRSRCQNLVLRLPEPVMALRWLTETGGTDPEEGALALEAACGSPLHALGLLREGLTQQYRQVGTALDRLRAGSAGPAEVAAELKDIDPDLLWRWLSLRTAAGVRDSARSGPGARALLELQAGADRNRALMSSPVRKDFLLHDWLIQWAGLYAR